MAIFHQEHWDALIVLARKMADHVDGGQANWLSVCRDFVEMLEADNPDFNRNAFLAAYWTSPGGEGSYRAGHP